MIGHTSGMLKKLIGIAVIVVVVVGAAFWWFVLRDDPPAELSVDSGTGGASTTVGTVPESLDGTWTIAAGDESTAGFRITESFASGLADHEAVGRSTDVDGSITVDGTSITKGDFTVDLSDLQFSDDPGGLSVANRANALKGRGLQTSQFPTTTFELTKPIEITSLPKENETITATATGDLTIHGVTKEVTFDVEAKVVGDTIRVSTKDPVPVVLTDYDIQKPTGGPIASIEDQGSFEFLIVLDKG